MERKRTRKKLTDLNFDLLKDIMICVARSSNGPTNLARTLSVCKLFRELCEDETILKAIDFNELKRSLLDGSLWNLSGLLVRAMRVRNPTTFEIVTEFRYEFRAYREAFRSVSDSLKMEIALKMEALDIRWTRFRVNDLAESLKKYNEHLNAYGIETKYLDEIIQVCDYLMCQWKTDGVDGHSLTAGTVHQSS